MNINISFENKNKILKHDKSIFLTKCGSCGKRIAVMVESDDKVHGGYTCNNCVPKNSSMRNGIDEAFETDLFDEIDFLK